MKHAFATALFATLLALSPLPLALTIPRTLSAQVVDGPRFTSAGELIRPVDFREWVFVTSGLGMTYNTPATATIDPPGGSNGIRLTATSNGTAPNGLTVVWTDTIRQALVAGSACP